LVSLAAKLQAVAYLEQTYEVSERRACRVLALHRRTKRRQSGQLAQPALIKRLHTLSAQYPRLGDRQLYHLLQGAHWRVSRETVRRLRQPGGRQVVKRTRKRRPVGQRTTTPIRPSIPTMSGVMIACMIRPPLDGG